jgi:membrane protease YdiL (CAAX protease family)
MTREPSDVPREPSELSEATREPTASEQPRDPSESRAGERPRDPSERERGRSELPRARQIDRRHGVAREIGGAAAIVLVTAAAIVGVGFLDDFLDLPSAWIDVGIRVAVGGGGLAWALSRPYVRRWLAFVSVVQWRAIDADKGPPLKNPHVRVLIIMVTCAVTLTIQEYVGGADKYEMLFPSYDGGDNWELWGFVWWSAWRVAGYTLMPMIVILCMPGERLRDYNVSARGFFRHLWIYAVMFVVFSPIVIIASTSDSFRDTYPFYRMANRSYFDLVAWESLYIVQFLSLEFFFRGFLLQGLRRVLGSNAIFVMVVPYNMIHYGKPMPETLGAIGAGLVLGTLAMRTRSIWGGVLIHVGVAMSMDILALQGCPPIGSDTFCHT